ncbi:hypothetical protein CC1G_05717 [Coprinopsis cinerea okayama7|uniref:Uncharacterized protein n=1 Tax=Coprinopsis cinerea (strain Okayama-7 / 130 / ATCC MYA-4618 / FGSC 9003) TaxID=240176 RepID=A8N9Z0_COPC7|nr:hypothetical protein CC1G_05717 [Coprinopsis cinerea okayama7\|eukprot:XP_001831646.2 hypothetical protein CC1G_05717 [Coprinopsis cinerea okayama7\
MPRPPGLRSEAENDRIADHRESKLTFAVIWDPEAGMQSFSGDSLDVLKDYQQGVDCPAYQEYVAQRTRRRKQPSRTKPAGAAHKPPALEPFAVLGARSKHFIGIHTSGVYEKYLKGLVPFKQAPVEETKPVKANLSTETSDDSTDENEEYTFQVNSVLFSDTDSLLTELDQTEIRYFRRLVDSDSDSPLDSPPEHSVNVPFTPNSVFTFAALWDPKKGFSTLQDGKLVRIPATSDSDSEYSGDNLTVKGSAVTAREELDDSLDGIQEIIYFPRANDGSNPARDAIPSSTLDGLNRGPWNGGAFYEEDEGFYETLGVQGGHNDCDQLPSRFSTTTTSTSRYIRVDGNLVPSPGTSVLAFMPRKMPSSTSAKGFMGRAKSTKKSEGATSGSTPAAPAVPRHCEMMPSAFKNINSPIPTRLSQVFKTKWTK